MSMSVKTKAVLFALGLSCILSTLPAYAARSHSSHAVSHPFGLGIVIGEPSGFTGKYFVSPTGAVDFGLAFSFNNYVMFNFDYLFHFPGAFGNSSEFVSHLEPYVGPGLLLALSSNSGLIRGGILANRIGDTAAVGIRIPIGLEWKPQDPTLGVFAEIVPGVAIAPATVAFFQGGIGIRYYF